MRRVLMVVLMGLAGLPLLCQQSRAEEEADLARMKAEFQEEMRLRTIKAEKEAREEFAEKQREKVASIARAAKAEKVRESMILKQPLKFQDALRKHKVSIGMNSEQALLSWGKPEEVNTTITARSRREQWVYGLKSYVYFDDGLVTAIQN